jgi:acetylornithine/succinyldiaminopimelate/putrescine aminotransferase
MWGLQLSVDALPVVEAARHRGLLVNRTNDRVVRMLPPLTIDESDLMRATDILDEVLAVVAPEVHA